jgi:hypothetical protein
MNGNKNISRHSFGINKFKTKSDQKNVLKYFYSHSFIIFEFFVALQRFGNVTFMLKKHENVT